MIRISARPTHLLALGVLAAGICAGMPLQAQNKTTAEKKIYCWDDASGKICGDALPADAVDNARVEFSSSGMRTRELQRAPTVEERAAAEALAQLEADAATANAEQVRHERAMIDSYDSEADLRRGFQHRINLVDAGARTSELGIESIRASLMSLLRRAAEAELAGGTVAKPVAANILAQHRGLRQQQALLERQKVQRRLLEGELAIALDRFRELKPESRS